jgi:hypothetical protein
MSFLYFTFDNVVGQIISDKSDSNKRTQRPSSEIHFLLPSLQIFLPDQADHVGSGFCAKEFAMIRKTPKQR